LISKKIFSSVKRKITLDVISRDEMSNLHRGHSIDAYQVSVHLAEGFQRKRLKCEK
jgi:hypothetical protein